MPDLRSRTQVLDIKVKRGKSVIRLFLKINFLTTIYTYNRNHFFCSEFVSFSLPEHNKCAALSSSERVTSVKLVLLPIPAWTC